MTVKLKAPIKNTAKRIPPPGRKLPKQEARDYVFKKYAEAMTLLAKH